MTKLIYIFKRGSGTVVFKNAHWLWKQTEFLPEHTRITLSYREE